ncbi:uncharacterized protein LOC114450712 [Parambassis ranga]|uniref:Uncharacterized protein LOC114450712 n=1 Tax=Parambassis ranga TaxID=210632 RepID=A0A6P7K6C5_9TELE|nr:uncharacterized protein LOC114450712 [Parambassis ranga]XP_028284829.1 uncharacterized protein LOC114450712 [Parambassis ranga]
MMLLFIVGQLLLRALLLQSIEDNEEWKTHMTQRAGGSERFGEFCLHLPDDSQWTSSKPDIPMTTQQLTPPEEPIMRHIPFQLASGREPESTTESDLIEEIQVITTDGIHSGCKCNKENMKKPTDTSRIQSLTKRYPTDTCSSTEYIETLADGREVCVKLFSFLEWFRMFLSPMPASDRSGAELVLTSPSLCNFCGQFTALDDVDLIDVKSLEVEKPSDHCPDLVRMNMKNGAVLCSDLSDLEIVVKNLEVFLQRTDASPPKNKMSRCHCRKKRPKSFTFTKLKIYIPSEVCLPAQFVEAVMDEEEVCMTVPDLLELLEYLDPGSQAVLDYEATITFVSCIGCIPRDLSDLKDARSLTINKPHPSCLVVLLFTLADNTIACVDSNHPSYSDLLKSL